MKKVLLFIAVLAALAVAAVAWLNLRGEDRIDEGNSAPLASAETIARGAYLVRAGNCMGCHTDRGGAPFAGGRAIDTPFGTVYTTNLTPHANGLGSWNASHFWRALHNGRAKDGRLLYPAFPYPNYTLVTREDSDAMFAYLRTVEASGRADTPHSLRWPYSTQAALAVWRAAYFSPASHAETQPAQSASWNRGAYLVRGLGHCSACHTQRNALGASNDMLDLSGGMIPMQNWYAPSLTAANEAGVAEWDTAQIARLLQAGVAPRGAVLGPMADVVMQSTQHLTPEDAMAMATYLKSLPPTPAASSPAAIQPGTSIAERGARLYEKHCAQCHGDRGEGVPNAYPALAGNRAVRMRTTANLVQVVLHGGFAPATQGNPRPFGMPPYATVLSDAEVAAVLSHIRSSWDNGAAPVSEFDVTTQRSTALP